MKLKLQLFWVSQIIGVLRYKFLLFFVFISGDIDSLLMQWKYIPQTTHQSGFFFFFSSEHAVKKGIFGTIVGALF